MATGKYIQTSGIPTRLPHHKNKITHTILSMTTFQKDRKSNAKFILKKWLFTITLFLTPFLFDRIFKTHLVKDGYPFMVVVFVTVSLFDKISLNRLHKLSFDHENKQVIFYYKSLFGDKRKIALYYEHAVVEVYRYKPKWYRKHESIRLCFLKNKMELFEINTYKDGFNTATMKEIIKAAETIPLTIKEWQ